MASSRCFVTDADLTAPASVRLAVRKVGAYWNDPRIHNFGNVGAGGWFHAIFAPIATFVIDQVPYSGFDARKAVLRTIPFSARVVDLCCGTAFSSKQTSLTTGVDTSRPMLTIAKLRNPFIKFARDNAETYGEQKSCDIATVMFGFHEMPQDARRRVLRNCLRIARNHVLIVDVCPTLKPSQTMLSGEPYLRNYQRFVDQDIAVSSDTRLWRLQRITVVPGHVVMWRLDRRSQQSLLKPISVASA